MHHVMIHPATYADCRNAVDRAFELFPLKIAGKKVVIKPNVLRTSKAEEHIVISPALLRAVVEKVEELSPSALVVGDNPGLFNYGDNENSFNETGLMAAAKGYYKNLGDTTQHLAFNPDSMPEVGVSKEIMDADIFISLPKFKTHGLTVLTGAIKNSYGILPGAQKARLHQLAGTSERFHELIGEVIACNQAIQQLLNSKINVKPKADPELCTACGACIEHCPVSALTMQDAVPMVDAGICIACFCCQEICPEKAMRLS